MATQCSLPGDCQPLAAAGAVGAARNGRVPAALPAPRPATGHPPRALPQTLRDHTKQRYFWRVANTPQWSVVDLNKVKWGQLRAKYAVGSFMMLANPW